MAFNDGDRPRRQARYAEEDTTFTTRKELLGWYSYGIAAEVYAVCGVGSFLPVTLEQLARERGVLYSNRTSPCVRHADDQNSTNLMARNVFRRENEQCIVQILGVEVTTASFAMYTFSIAVLVQALVLISFSSIADYGNNRKRLLLTFALFGSLSSMLFLFVVPKIFFVGSVLVVIGVTCLGSSFVLLNSFLPLLSGNDRSIRDKAATEIALSRLENFSGEEIHNEQSAAVFETDAKSISPQLALSTKISSKGVGYGYIAAVFMQLVSIGLLFVMKKIATDPASQTLPLRLVLALVGIWWLAFSIPTHLYLKARPGPPLRSTIPSTSSRFHTYWRHVTFAWAGLWKTIKLAIQLRQATLFLVAWFLLSDSIATVSGTAVLFARTELNMGTIPIAILSITVMLSGILGAFLWPILSRRFHLQSNHTIVTCILLMELIPLYGLLAYLPFIRAWRVGGLQQAWEIYPLGAIHGFVMGGISSYCRSFYGLLIPPGKEAAFYALYAITDKGSSAIGPAVVGRIVDRTGSIRLAFVFLAILILAPAPLMWMVDAEKGREDALAMAAPATDQRNAIVEAMEEDERHGGGGGGGEEWEVAEEAERLLRQEES